MDDPFYGWRAYLEGKIEVVTLPGKHLTVFEEPNQRRMAEAILAATAALDPGRPSAPADPPFTW
jgi:thioesterase domain-containing protein